MSQDDTYAEYLAQQERARPPIQSEDDSALMEKALAAMRQVPLIYRQSVGTSIGYIDCYFETYDAFGDAHPVRFKMHGGRVQAESVDALATAINACAEGVRGERD